MTSNWLFPILNMPRKGWKKSVIIPLLVDISLCLNTMHPTNDIVNITLHFFLKDVRSMLPPAVNHSIAVS